MPHVHQMPRPRHGAPIGNFCRRSRATSTPASTRPQYHPAKAAPDEPCLSSPVERLRRGDRTEFTPWRSSTLGFVCLSRSPRRAAMRCPRESVPDGPVAYHYPKGSRFTPAGHDGAGDMGIGSSLPGAARAAVDDLLAGLDREPPGRIEGFYVVGSTCLGAFRSDRSDVDFVAVVADGGLDAAELPRLATPLPSTGDRSRRHRPDPRTPARVGRP